MAIYGSILVLVISSFSNKIYWWWEIKGPCFTSTTTSACKVYESHRFVRWFIDGLSPYQRYMTAFFLHSHGRYTAPNNAVVVTEKLQWYRTTITGLSAFSLAIRWLKETHSFDSLNWLGKKLKSVKNLLSFSSGTILQNILLYVSICIN